MRDDFESIIDELDDVLETERAALLAGHLEEVNRLFDRKTRLIDAFAQLDEADAAAVTALRRKVERNQGLLEAAADGVRSVARRLAAIRRVRESLETYDAQGKRNTVDVKSGATLEKRA